MEISPPLMKKVNTIPFSRPRFIALFSVSQSRSRASCFCVPHLPPFHIWFLPRVHPLYLSLLSLSFFSPSFLLCSLFVSVICLKGQELPAVVQTHANACIPISECSVCNFRRPADGRQHPSKALQMHRVYVCICSPPCLPA